ncbi:15-hydroxyprostaglandin dehydrogenase [NAD(+)] [Leptinotarsa decemlineata]|uniref:15-hydroxyprostaglandin dehydrogenase [NAD(+)] n=1 Tax=Leptinotarsa decemlineata TaxID=7539 RepID=UPI003D305034
MVFTIKGKVAIITGGASGLGKQYAKELLRNGLKAVILADLNQKLAIDALTELENEFGPNRAIFVRTDVTQKESFEDAFKETIKVFGAIDILFNNAGILNDAIWEKQILVNLNGMVHGMLLALEKYLPDYQQGPEAVVVNISSIAGVIGSPHVPIYCATKHAVLGLTKSWGVSSFYRKFKVRVVAVCPGITRTPLISDMADRSLGTHYEENGKDLAAFPVQDPETAAKEVVEVVKYAPNGSVWVVEGGEPAYQYIFPEREEMKKNVLPKNNSIA